MENLLEFANRFNLINDYSSSQKIFPFPLHATPFPFLSVGVLFPFTFLLRSVAESIAYS